jgi:hypothetical protein
MEPHSIAINLVFTRINSKVEDLERAQRSLDNVALQVKCLREEIKQLEETLKVLRG